MAMRSAAAWPPTSACSWRTSREKAGSRAKRAAAPAAATASSRGAQAKRAASGGRRWSQPHSRPPSPTARASTAAAKGNRWRHSSAPTNQSANCPRAAITTTSAAPPSSAVSAARIAQSRHPGGAGVGRARRRLAPPFSRAFASRAADPAAMTAGW
ncbi:MAG: hypothetical protein U0802_08335 [Candidatus Binatia bacterium]